MQELSNKLSAIGGGISCVLAKVLMITPMGILEIGLYGLIGSLIGEGVKLLADRLFRKKKKNEG